MLHPATKYGGAREQAAKQAPGPTRVGATLKKGKVHTSGLSTGLKGFGILVPKRGKVVSWGEVLWRGMKDGGTLRRYLDCEKVLMDEEIRRVARATYGRKQNNKSEYQMLARVPARLFFRWKRQDPHFWEDDSNLKSLKRDNPDLPIFV